MWNVKVVPLILARLLQYDLIETLWNVKCFPVADFRAEQHRFNRDIVECKATSCTRKNENEGTDLIETLWNVKLIFICSVSVSDADLIETLWNVKTKSEDYFLLNVSDLIETLWNVKTTSGMINCV